MVDTLVTTTSLLKDASAVLIPYAQEAVVQEAVGSHNSGC